MSVRLLVTRVPARPGHALCPRPPPPGRPILEPLLAPAAATTGDPPAGRLFKPRRGDRTPVAGACCWRKAAACRAAGEAAPPGPPALGLHAGPPRCCCCACCCACCRPRPPGRCLVGGLAAMPSPAGERGGEGATASRCGAGEAFQPACVPAPRAGEVGLPAAGCGGDPGPAASCALPPGDEALPPACFPAGERCNAAR